jgi:hypothetical protein
VTGRINSVNESACLKLLELSDSAVNSAQVKNAQCDLITFLAAVQLLEIDILPITWQSARKPIGEGATGKINEAVVNMQTSLAFKCVSERQRERESESKILQAFVDEITVLGQPMIRRHPTIVKLQGICWDVQSDQNVWPVLVFEKSRFGDLGQFLKSPEGRALNITARVMLCMNIGLALLNMHVTSKLLRAQHAK